MLRFKEIDVGSLPVGGMRVWNASHRSWSFVISYEPKPGDHHGYVASWRHLMAQPGSQQTHLLQGKPYDTLEAAEAACNDTLRDLLKNN